MPDESTQPPVGADSIPGQTADSRSGDLHPFGGKQVADMSLEELREMRKVLTDRESQISYWRRIIQARLDLLRDGSVKRGATVEGLQRILSQQMGANSRKGMLSLRPQQDQPIAGLDHLWHRGINGADDEQLERDLLAAEHQLSHDRNELHGLIDAATAELISRYHNDPLLALTALPHRRERPTPL